MSVELIIGMVVGGVLLILAEVFVPGGVVGTLGAIVMFAGIVAGFYRDLNFGLYLLLGAVVFGVVIFWLWLKYFPRSPMGKRLILQQDAKTWQGYDKDNQALLGQEGLTHSRLRPAGIAVIAGHRVDVVTQGEMIDENRPIRVLEIEGNRIVVVEIKNEVTNDNPNQGDKKT